MEKRTIIVNFPNATVGNIYGPRWAATARILDLSFRRETHEYGLGKYYYKMVVSGDAKHLDDFVNFVNESLQFADLEIANIF